MKNQSTRAVLLGAGALAILMAPSIAQAQEKKGVDQIIVTAQKREQNQQDIPVAVASFNAEIMEQSGIRDIKDLIAIAPGLMVTSTSSEASTTVRIRGVGTVGDNTGLESSAGIFIDGVYRSRNSVGFGDLGEIKRIELLRGPQGTLFGKNTSAGALNVITKGPEYDVDMGAEVTIGNLHAFGGSAYVTGALNEDKTVAFRLYGARRLRDGYVVNADGSGDASFDQDVYTGRAQLEFTPTDEFKLKIIADYSKRDENCCSGVPITVTPSSLLINGIGGTGYPVNFDKTKLRALPRDAFTAYYNRPIGQKIEEKGVSAEMQMDTSFGDLTSITAIRNWNNSQGMDLDFTNADIIYRPGDGSYGNDFSTFTQELRLAGSASNVDWLVGGFFMDEQLTRNDTFRFGAGYESYLGLLLSAGTNPAAVSGITGRPFGTNFPMGQGMIADLYRHNAQTIALFTHNTWAVNEQLSLTGGLRWTSEDKNVDAQFSTNAPGCAALEGVFGLDPVAGALAGGATAAQAKGIGTICLPWARSGLDNGVKSQAVSSSKLSGTAKVAYRFNDDMMAYGSYARGFKAGGINLDRSFAGGATPGTLGAWNTVFAPETVDTFEVGLKTENFDNSLLANATLFHSQFTDFQLNTFDGTSFFVTSVPSVTSEGGELELIYMPKIDGLTMRGGVTYANTRYGTAAGTPANLAGQQMSLAPKWYATASVTYERPFMDNMLWRVHVDGRAVSSYNTGSDLDAPKRQDGFATFNSRLTIADADDHWSVELWARNVLDQTYMQVAFDTPLSGPGAFSMFPGAPRTWGVTLRGSF